MKRWKMSKGASRRQFRRTASASHVRGLNYAPAPMRGGIRL